MMSENATETQAAEAAPGAAEATADAAGTAASPAPEPSTAEPTSDAEAPSAAAEPPADAAVPSAAAEPAAAPAGDAPRRGRPRTRVEDVVVGKEIRGKVVGLAKFGAFVDIGAMTDGLVHLTELPKRGVRRVEDVLKSGDTVDVWVKDVDVGTNKISLTMRRPPLRPMAKLSEGDVLIGTVTSIAKYGVFVDIASDTEGLVHVSEMSSGFVQRPEDIVKSGDQVEVRIKEIDSGKQRISLSMKGLASDQGLAAGAAVGDQMAGDGDYEVPEEPEERMPTVVELALRRALGEDDASGAAKPAAKSGGRQAKSGELGDVYSRMLEEYRAAKAAEK